jgi:hypothetical protein
MDGVDIGDLQADAAPAEHLTNCATVAAWSFLPTKVIVEHVPPATFFTEARGAPSGSCRRSFEPTR